MEAKEKESKPLKSSLLQAYSYDANSHELTVTYKDGNEYTYSRVDPSLMSKVFDSSGSVGSKFVRLIKRGNCPAIKQ